MPATRRQGRRELRGTLIIVVMVTIAGAIFFLDRLGALFNRTYTVVAVFPTAPGIRSGAPVWVAGVPSGTIRGIRLLPPLDTLARVAVDLELRRGVAAQVRRDSRVRFNSARLVGEKVIEVEPGTAGAPRLAEGDTLHVTPGRTTEELIASARAARLALDSLMGEVVPLRQRLTQRMAAMHQVSREAGLAKAELARLREGMRSGSLGKLMALQRPGGPLDRAQRRAAELQKLVGQAQGRMAHTRQELAPRQKALMGHVHELQGQVTELRRLMAEPVGTAGRVQRDSALQRSITGARSQLDSLLTEARKHPARFVF